MKRDKTSGKSLYGKMCSCAGILMLAGGIATAQVQSPPPGSMGPPQSPGMQGQQDPMAATTNEGMQSMADREFVRQALQGGMAEVQLGQLALKKSTNDQVKQFAQSKHSQRTSDSVPWFFAICSIISRCWSTTRAPSWAVSFS